MNRHLKPGIIFSLLILITGCTGFHHHTPATAGNAMMYIYRTTPDNPGKKPLRLDYPDVLIDGKSVGALKNNTYLAVELTPGRHDIRITGMSPNARWEQKDIIQTIDAKAGQTYYRKLNINYNMMHTGIFRGPAYKIFLTPQDEGAAYYDIRDTTLGN